MFTTKQIFHFSWRSGNFYSRACSAIRGL